MTSSKEPAFAIVDGARKAYESALVHVDSTAFRYGAMVFEGLRGYSETGAQQVYVVKLAEHVARLRESAKVMRFESVPSTDELTEGVLSCIRANDLRTDLYARAMVWVDGGGGAASLGPIAWGVTVTPRGPTFAAGGIAACVSSWQRTTDNSIPPRIKCAANYQNARLALTQASVDGYDLALLLDRDGHVTESPTSCVFVVRRGEVITPPVYSDILESITRDIVIELAISLGFRVTERPIDRTELYVADEVFVCGTGAELAAVVSIDRHPVGSGATGPITDALRGLYMNVVRGLDGDVRWKKWLTAVY